MLADVKNVKEAALREDLVIIRITITHAALFFFEQQPDPGLSFIAGGKLFKGRRE